MSSNKMSHMPGTQFTTEAHTYAMEFYFREKRSIKMGCVCLSAWLPFSKFKKIMKLILKLDLGSRNGSLTLQCDLNNHFEVTLFYIGEMKGLGKGNVVSECLL